ncbi:hypothetical protein O6H91_08G011200 [Diphasiastrum complanatum]|uniref:Uncharacterized protein n=1 Tax=Diphasiastrum complanatum TaxID=34168 RepID=A0ACC2CUW9_DIPCM|nr:hypothetical protein O6H91_08G011200 [Diphasiastrum complanatum]
MAIHFYRTYTPSTRNRSVVSGFEEMVRSRPKRNSTSGYTCRKGHNNRGIITSQHTGGGDKRLYRQIDFRRSERGISGRIVHLTNCNINAQAELVHYPPHKL